jgi:hypothetical protein
MTLSKVRLCQGQHVEIIPQNSSHDLEVVQGQIIATVLRKEPVPARVKIANVSVRLSK